MVIHGLIIRAITNPQTYLQPYRSKDVGPRAHMQIWGVRFFQVFDKISDFQEIAPNFTYSQKL